MRQIKVCPGEACRGASFHCSRLIFGNGRIRRLGELRAYRCVGFELFVSYKNDARPTSARGQSRAGVCLRLFVLMFIRSGPEGVDLSRAAPAVRHRSMIPRQTEPPPSPDGTFGEGGGLSPVESSLACGMGYPSRFSVTKRAMHCSISSSLASVGMAAGMV